MNNQTTEFQKAPEKRMRKKQETTSAAHTPQALKIQAAMDYLNQNYDFRYNTIANEVEFKKKTDKAFIYFDEFEYNGIMIEMDLAGIHIADNKYRNIVVSKFISQKYDPFKEYLSHLPKWDGKTDYIENFLQQVNLTSPKKLLNNINESEIEIKLSDVNNLPFSGEVFIDEELVKYSLEKNEKKLIVLERGFKDTKAVNHKRGTKVYLPKEKNNYEYLINGFKKWFVALVMSLVEDRPEPFFINQVAFILVGREHGKFKSTWLGSIVPSHLRLRYYYQSTFNPHNKDHEKYLATKLLIDLDEMGGYIKSDIETMKSTITRSQISLRLPYGKADIYAKRRASFCGSINDRQFLRDETGSRRWFVVEIDSIDFDPKFNVDLMYAQALALYKDSFRYWWDSVDIKQLEDRNAEYTQLSLEEGYLLLQYEKPDARDDSSMIQWLTTEQIASKIADANPRMNINGSVVRNLGKALTKNKFERKSVWMQDKKSSLYAWKVKPLISANFRTEQSEDHKNSENNVF